MATAVPPCGASSWPWENASRFTADLGQVVEDRDPVARRVVVGGAVGDLDDAAPPGRSTQQRQQVVRGDQVGVDGRGAGCAGRRRGRAPRSGVFQSAGPPLSTSAPQMSLTSTSMWPWSAADALGQRRRPGRVEVVDRHRRRRCRRAASPARPSPRSSRGGRSRTAAPVALLRPVQTRSRRPRPARRRCRDRRPGWRRPRRPPGRAERACRAPIPYRQPAKPGEPASGHGPAVSTRTLRQPATVRSRHRRRRRRSATWRRGQRETGAGCDTTPPRPRVTCPVRQRYPCPERVTERALPDMASAIGP